MRESMRELENASAAAGGDAGAESTAPPAGKTRADSQKINIDAIKSAARPKVDDPPQESSQGNSDVSKLFEPRVWVKKEEKSKFSLSECIQTAEQAESKYFKSLKAVDVLDMDKTASLTMEKKRKSAMRVILFIGVPLIAVTAVASLFLFGGNIAAPELPPLPKEVEKAIERTKEKVAKGESDAPKKDEPVKAGAFSITPAKPKANAYYPAVIDSTAPLLSVPVPKILAHPEADDKTSFHSAPVSGGDKAAPKDLQPDFIYVANANAMDAICYGDPVKAVLDFNAKLKAKGITGPRLASLSLPLAMMLKDPGYAESCLETMGKDPAFAGKAKSFQLLYNLQYAGVQPTDAELAGLDDSPEARELKALQMMSAGRCDAVAALPAPKDGEPIFMKAFASWRLDAKDWENEVRPLLGKAPVFGARVHIFAARLWLGLTQARDLERFAAKLPPPESALTYIILAEYKKKSGDKDQAKLLYRKALQIQPSPFAKLAERLESE